MIEHWYQRLALLVVLGGLILAATPAPQAAEAADGTLRFVLRDRVPNKVDANLFEGATFSDMRRTRGPGVWINAADIYNRTTFVFGSAAFAALCSDLASYPIADAVAAFVRIEEI